jgi:hypothetical protein
MLHVYITPDHHARCLSRDDTPSPEPFAAVTSGVSGALPTTAESDQAKESAANQQQRCGLGNRRRGQREIDLRGIEQVAAVGPQSHINGVAHIRWAY